MLPIAHPTKNKKLPQTRPAAFAGRCLVASASAARQVVLVIGDQFDLQAQAEQMLAQTTFELLCAEDTGVALELLKHYGHEIRFVLLDMRLPHHTPAGALYELSRHPELQVLLLTGSVTD